MKARNKHTGEECEIYWEMCDVGRKCQASDKPITPAPCIMYNAVVDDYDLLVDDQWVDGSEYIKSLGKYRELTQEELEYIKRLGEYRELTQEEGMEFFSIKYGKVLNEMMNELAEKHVSGTYSFNTICGRIDFVIHDK